MAVPRSTEALVVGRLRIPTLASGDRAVQGPVVALRIPVSRAVDAAMLAAMGIEWVLVRLAELLAALSVSTDLGMGQPGGHAARTCLLAVRLARELGLSDDQVSDVFYVALLRYVGCAADASEVAAFAGDEIALAVAVAPFVMWGAAAKAFRGTFRRGTTEYFANATDDSSTAIEWQMPGRSLVDALAVLVLTTASLRAAAALYPDGDWDVRRFRPNLLLDVPGTGWLEDT